MIYFENDKMKIRSMEQADIDILQERFTAQGWEKPLDVLQAYYTNQQQGVRHVFIAEYCGELAGYVTLLPNAEHGAFQDENIPEISDFNVFLSFQKKGIGNHLLDVAEAKAKENSTQICLGVGLHSGYGSAQRMYVKRGYVPDGTGVWYENQIAKPYSYCENSDELVLYLLKEL